MLAFYPLASTGGCTREMSTFQTQIDTFAGENAEVVGVSVDNWARAGQFAEKLCVTFPLLSDFPKNEAGQDYGVYDADRGFHSRVTFVISPDRTVIGTHSSPPRRAGVARGRRPPADPPAEGLAPRVPFDPTTPLRVEEKTGGSSDQWQIAADLLYHAKHQNFLVHTGFVTNFASVPRPFTWLVPTSSLYTRAADLHDYLCRQANFPRNDADGIFRRAMGELGVPTLRRYVIWAAVRIAARLRGAKLSDIIGIVLLALLVLPIATLVGALILAVLSVLWVVEASSRPSARLSARPSARPRPARSTSGGPDPPPKTSPLGSFRGASLIAWWRMGDSNPRSPP